MYNLKIAIVLNTKLSGFLSLVPITIAESLQFHMENFLFPFLGPCLIVHKKTTLTQN